MLRCRRAHRLQRRSCALVLFHSIGTLRRLYENKSTWLFVGGRSHIEAIVIVLFVCRISYGTVAGKDEPNSLFFSADLKVKIFFYN